MFVKNSVLSFSHRLKIFQEFPRYDTINEYLDYLSKYYCDRVDIKIVDGGIHGREWLSITTALYCVYMLVEQYDNNFMLLNNMDWIIVPVVNPDGYEYAHVMDRFWRKTRKPTIGNAIGTDCNRNFDFYWEKGCQNPKNLTYRGDTPFSEPETKAIKNIFDELKSDCKFYLTLHTHAKAFLYPWGYTSVLPRTWRELNKLAKIGRDAILNKTGTTYRYGPISSVLRRRVHGGSCDYAFGIIGIPYVMCFELGGGCFNPPSKNIRKLAKESWVGIRAMAKYIINTYNHKVESKCSEYSIVKKIK